MTVFFTQGQQDPQKAQVQPYQMILLGKSIVEEEVNGFGIGSGRSFVSETLRKENRKMGLGAHQPNGQVWRLEVVTHHATFVVFKQREQADIQPVIKVLIKK